VQVDAATSTSSVYASTGLVSTATAAQLQHAGTKYPAFVSPDTVLTDDFTGGAATITALAKQWTAGTTNAYDAAVAIETHLRDPRNFTYTLNPPQVPAGQWPIVYFLVTGHRGYCQYFASSMGAMLRGLGIPTRLVVGYGPGTPLEEAPRQGVGRIAVSTSDAHAWVESYFPGYGWIPFEPTPPSHEGAYVPFPRGGDASTSTTPSPTPQPSSPTPAPNAIAPVNPSNGTGHGNPGALMGLILVAGGVLLLASVVLLWLLSPRSLSGAWRRLEALGAWAGVRRRPSETYREYAERLAAARPRGTAPLAAIAVALGRAVYSEAGSGGADAEALRGWRKLVLALARSRRVRLRRSAGAVSSSI
jgi:hypothetical protein